jgi:hypothetical protein
MSHTGQWSVRLHLFGDGGTTKAQITLDAGTAALAGHGTVHCNPADTNVPETGD